MTEANKNAVEFIEAEWLRAQTGILHGFFTRRGGISSGIYEALNCGVGSQDDQSAVARNRARVANQIGVESESLVTPYQIHSAKALLVDGPLPPNDRPRADALVTTTPGLAVAISTADCTPVLFADVEARIVGAAHAGWRGALDGVLEATIELMEEQGANRLRMQAAIGPTISQSNYEVGDEFRQRFVSVNPHFSRFFLSPNPGARAHFDLPAFVRHRLLDAGISEISELELCTYGNESDFFSYRRATHRGEPDYGRQISAIVLK